MSCPSHWLLSLRCFPVSSVISFQLPYMDFFCFQGMILINRTNATLLIYVASTAPGSCSQYACPARESRRHSQRATALELTLSAAKLRSNTTAVWDHCAAGAYPAGQCFGDWHCVFSWLNRLLCLVTMPFCLLELSEEFSLWLWWTLVKLRCDGQKNVFSLMSVLQKAIL